MQKVGRLISTVSDDMNILIGERENRGALNAL